MVGGYEIGNRFACLRQQKIEELDTRRQTISKAIAELSVETISPQQIKKLSYYLDNWDSIDFDDKRKAADSLISTIKATSDRVQIEWKSDISALSPLISILSCFCTPCTLMFPFLVIFHVEIV